MTDMTPVPTQVLTPSEQGRVEQLVWTLDKGRGWAVPAQPIPSEDLHLLQRSMAELEGRRVPADRVVIIAHLARLANHFRTERPADKATHYSFWM